MISGFGGKGEGDDGNIIHLSIFAWNEQWHGREGARDKKNEGRALDLYAKGFKMFLIPFFGMLLRYSRFPTVSFYVHTCR